MMTASDISEANLKKISDYADGWISLIYILLSGLKNGLPVGMSSSIYELINKVLYNTYDIHIRDFLLKLSIMNEFTAKQASYVTQEEK